MYWEVAGQGWTCILSCGNEVFWLRNAVCFALVSVISPCRNLTTLRLTLCPHQWWQYLASMLQHLFEVITLKRRPGHIRKHLSVTTRLISFVKKLKYGLLFDSFPENHRGKHCSVVWCQETVRLRKASALSHCGTHPPLPGRLAPGGSPGKWERL